MHCLRWWLPIFLLPLPAASPFLLILFIVVYAIRTKPCAYCSVIILGLMFSTCSFYHYSPLDTPSITPTQSTTAKVAIGISLESSGTTTSTSLITAKSISTDAAPTESSHKGESEKKGKKSPSSCWIDFSQRRHSGGEDKSRLSLGKWSAPAWRRHPSVLSRMNQQENDIVSTGSAWRRILSEGLFVGFDDVGFRLKLAWD